MDSDWKRKGTAQSCRDSVGADPCDASQHWVSGNRKVPGSGTPGVTKMVTEGVRVISILLRYETRKKKVADATE